MQKKYLLINTVLFFSVVLLHACSNGKATDKNNANDTIPVVPGKDMTIPGNFSNQTTLVFDSLQLTSFIEKYPQLQPVKSKLDSFYYKRKFAFAWYDNNGLIEQAANLYNRMQNLNEEGLPDSLPYKTEFTNLVNNNGLDSANHPSVPTEIMLTAQYFLYANKVWGGIDQKEVTSMDWFLPRKKVSYNELLDSIVSGKDILDNAPVYRQYGLLKDQLNKYRQILSAGGFPKINADKKTYKEGDSSAVVDSIRKVLFLTGDLANNNNSNIFDDELELGIKNFQLRIGDKQDGAAGPFVLKELKVPVEKRIQQIVVNMERSRWVPVNITGNYVVINIPEYKLHVYENDSLAWNMDVVVGAAAHKTVVFNGNIKYIVFSPYWNVPSGILRNEVLPGIKRNPNYLASHNMEWNGNSVRQKP
ncbi:MAG: L,D-transpeptidase family protein, partial [Panacibacter sp.]